jgi:WD40 repeat protein
VPDDDTHTLPPLRHRSRIILTPSPALRPPAAETGREKAVLRGHTDVASSAIFSPDGKRVLTGSADRTARLWGADTGR